jgi:hypothetical protein
VEGTGSGQVGEETPGDAAVVLAACVDVSGISPGNNRGDCDVADVEPVAPVAPFVDPVFAADPVDVPDVAADDKADVDTLRGSDPIVLALLFVWPFGCATV